MERNFIFLQIFLLTELKNQITIMICGSQQEKERSVSVKIRTGDAWTRIKMAWYSSLTAGVVLSSACSATDVRHNLVAGTQSFIRDYATDFLGAVIPSPDELIGGAETP